MNTVRMKNLKSNSLTPYPACADASRYWELWHISMALGSNSVLDGLSADALSRGGAAWAGGGPSGTGKINPCSNPAVPVLPRRGLSCGQRNRSSATCASTEPPAGPRCVAPASAHRPPSKLSPTMGCSQNPALLGSSQGGNETYSALCALSPHSARLPWNASIRLP